MLLSIQWEQGSLPDDDASIARMLGMTPARFRPLWSVLSKKFPVSDDDGMRRNRRLERVRVEQEEHSKRRSAAGQSGASARWQTHGNANGNGNADALQEQWQKHGSPTPTPTPEESEKEKRPRTARRVPAEIPPDLLTLAWFPALWHQRLDALPAAKRPTAEGETLQLREASAILASHGPEVLRGAVEEAINRKWTGFQAKWLDLPAKPTSRPGGAAYRPLKDDPF